MSDTTATAEGFYSVREFCDTYRIGTTSFYEELNQGRLTGTKVRGRTMIAHSAVKEWVNNLPAWTPGRGPKWRVRPRTSPTVSIIPTPGSASVVDSVQVLSMADVDRALDCTRYTTRKILKKFNVPVIAFSARHHGVMAEDVSKMLLALRLESESKR